MVSILILESIFCIFVCLFFAYLLAFLSFSIFFDGAYVPNGI